MESTYSQPSMDDDGDINGECPVCGKYRKRIERGRMKPCYTWKREKGAEDDDINDTE
jgi:hypothetical protein